MVSCVGNSIVNTWTILILQLFANLVLDKRNFVHSREWDWNLADIFTSDTLEDNNDDGEHLNIHTRSLFDPDCQLSNEATKVKLIDFFKKVKKVYYETNRYMAATNSDFDDKQIKQVFQPYNPSPTLLKSRADQINNLMKRLNKLESKFDDLNPRELRMIFQFRYFLQSNLDNIYEGYYDGIWMLGPDYFCEQPICLLHRYLVAVLKIIKVRNLKDLELIIFWIKEHRKTFEQYLKNVKLGVKSGMVNPLEVCKAASKTFALSFNKVNVNGAEGALKMTFARLLNDKEYYTNVPAASFKAFARKHRDAYFDILNDTIKNDFGKPLKALIDYLKNEHRAHCSTGDVSSGLGRLPLDYVYKDGVKQEDMKTDKTLPSGETIDVSIGYTNLLEYYTASNITGERAIKLGYKLVDQFYKQVLKMGHEITGEKNEKKMIGKFLKVLNGPSQFCNERPFPKNESNEDAYDICDNDEGASLWCPFRWKAKETWFGSIKAVMKKGKATIGDFFYTDGPKKSTPDCDVEVIPEYNPSNGVPSYLESDEKCTLPASYFVPFFKAKMGPKYEDFSTNFHEARPGHHLQIQGYLENFEDECGGVSEWITDVNDYYPSFSEGWGVYSENPILLEDTDVLDKEDKLARYGVLKWQIWRALRLIVDVGFHQMNMTRQEAIDLFKKYTWDDSDTMMKEVTRYQGAPGQATSYIIGQQSIIKLRNRTKESLGDKFNIKDFHYHILSQAQAPFDFISIYIDKYIQCTKDKTSGKFCPQILAGNQQINKKYHLTRTPKEQRTKALFQMFKRRKHM